MHRRALTHPGKIVYWPVIHHWTGGGRVISPFIPVSWTSAFKSTDGAALPLVYMLLCRRQTAPM